MIIYLKDKGTLVVGDFYFKCCIGKNGLNSRKKEGDYTTPKGLFNLNKLYYRKDRVGLIKTKIKNFTKPRVTKGPKTTRVRG